MKNNYPTMAQRRLASILPSDLYQPGDVLTKKEQQRILSEVAQKHPERYPEVVESLNALGIDVARLDGSSTIGIRDLTTPVRAKIRRREMRDAIKKLLDSTPDQKARGDGIRKVLADNVAADLEEVYEDSKAENNPLAIQVDNAGRGNKSSIVAIRAGELGAKDFNGKVIPILIDRSYAQGLTPMQYEIGMSAARSGVVDAKMCCAGDTLVRMADGTAKRIDAIEPGEYVLGANSAGLTLPVRVMTRWENGLKECKNFKFRLGCSDSFVSITASEDHKVLSQIRKSSRTSTWDSDRQIRLRPLSLATASAKHKKGFFHIIRPTGSAFSQVDNLRYEPMAYVFGVMLGDGCMAPSTKGTYRLSIGEAELVEPLRCEFSRFGLNLNYTSGYSYTVALPEEDRQRLFIERSVGGVRLKGQLSAAKRRLRRFLGDRLSHQKKLPKQVWSWDDESCRQLIAGLFITDGGFYVDSERPNAGVVSFYSSSLKMISQIRRLLSYRFGVHANNVTKDDREDRDRPCYRISVSCPFSIERLYELIADKLFGSKRSNFDYIVAHKEKVGRSAYEAAKVAEVTDHGLIETFDLEVDHPDHMYVLANGIIMSNSVASSGYANKTMAQAVHRLLVTARDDDSSLGRGMPVNTDDGDNDGAALASDYGPFKRNTIITPKIRKTLANLGHDEILVRSPIASGAKDGGLLAYDLGERNYGRLPDIGEYANLSATNALGESVTQAMLNSKHNSNIKPEDLLEDDGEGFTLKGFDLIDKVLNPSSERRGFAVHAEADGRVGLVREAPQGGQYVTIGMQQHYMPPGSKLRIKPGQEIEAGDQLTEGVPDHVAVTKHQGIGEGRRRVVEAFTQALKKNGQRGARRNIEILARGLVDRVQLNEEYGDYIPDDIVPYHRIEAEWRPRENAVELPAKRAVGKFLEKPVLHYSIGTPVRKSVIDRLAKHGVENVLVNDDPPPFTPTIVRASDLMQSDPDWMTRQLGGHIRRSFDEAVMRGRDSDTGGTSYVGSRAELVSFNRGQSKVKLDEPDVAAPTIQRFQ